MKKTDQVNIRLHAKQLDILNKAHRLYLEGFSIADRLPTLSEFVRLIAVEASARMVAKREAEEPIAPSNPLRIDLD